MHQVLTLLFLLFSHGAQQVRETGIVRWWLYVTYLIIKWTIFQQLLQNWILWGRHSQLMALTLCSLNYLICLHNYNHQIVYSTCAEVILSLVTACRLLQLLDVLMLHLNSKPNYKWGFSATGWCFYIILLEPPISDSLQENTDTVCLVRSPPHEINSHTSIP